MCKISGIEQNEKKGSDKREGDMQIILSVMNATLHHGKQNFLPTYIKPTLNGSFIPINYSAMLAFDVTKR